MAELPRPVPSWLSEPDVGVDVLVPNGAALEAALPRTTVLGVGAHPDDLELLAPGAIGDCLDDPERWFAGVTVTDGAGSATAGPFAGLTGPELAARRRQEQRNAARIGRYGAQVQLGLPSVTLRDPAGAAHLVSRLTDVLDATTPQLVVTHSPVDRHRTHVAVTVAVLEACRALPPERRPPRVLGVELWGGLDWLSDQDRVRLDVSAHTELARRLVAAHASQVSAKDYAGASEGRRRANATFDDPATPDGAEEVLLAVDLTPVVHDDARDPAAHVEELLGRFVDASLWGLRSVLSLHGRAPG